VLLKHMFAGPLGLSERQSEVWRRQLGSRRGVVLTILLTEHADHGDDAQAGDALPDAH
jgi:hypothetical protein